MTLGCWWVNAHFLSIVAKKWQTIFLYHKTQPEPLSERKGSSLSSDDSVGTSKAVKHEKLTVTPHRWPKRKEYSGQQQKRIHLRDETTQFMAFHHCCIKKPYRNRTSNCRSALIRHHHAGSRVTLMYSTEFGIKGKKTLIWKTLTFTGSYIFSGSLSIWSYASCLKQFAAPWGNLEPGSQRYC